MLPGKWVPALSVDHLNVIGTCTFCHDGVTAGGKSAIHIDVNPICHACHLGADRGIPDPWAPIPYTQVDHLQILNNLNCATCHSKSANHPPATESCSICHAIPRIFQWDEFTSLTQLHTDGLVPTSCNSCHDGTIASGKSINHINTDPASQCGDCHVTSTWAGATFDHALITAGCISCHDGVTATGKDLATHIATSDRCEACHIVSSWTTLILPLDHAQMVFGVCEECHFDGGPAPGPGTAHDTACPNYNDPTLGLSCGDCHNTRDWGNPDSSQCIAATTGGGTTFPPGMGQMGGMGGGM